MGSPFFSFDAKWVCPDDGKEEKSALPSQGMEPVCENLCEKTIPKCAKEWQNMLKSKRRKVLQYQ
jgi:hypothetical protein